MQTIGILGAGIMGNGIAQVSAIAGYNVLLYDIEQKFIDRGLTEMEKSLSRMVKKEKLLETDVPKIMGKIKASLDLKDFKDCDLIIEAIPEIISLKKETFAKLDIICKKDCIIASNTSAISITDLASSVSAERQTKFIGLHFFNPVPMMKLVEVIKGEVTSEDTLNTSIEYCKIIQKETVVINDLPGFATTRLAVIILNEAVFMLQDGLGSVEEIDKSIKLGLAHPMGPLTLGDLIGLDTALHILDYLRDEFGPKFQACPLLRKMVRAGKLGRKSGEGFYKY
ncbi:MAG: 3-hydroxybutyryl-CoA dehydrogenase [Candidatus Heimdallarchaeota archaeon]|nr:3-hydroxybutyryl-CoA dehydrogenase [Candidatus Heimdallarchaeota archaeon]